MEEKKYYYSEIFYSIQGEGHYTGVPTAWIRFFLCNLQCNGFGQIDPTNPDTYELPFEDFDVDSDDDGLLQVKIVESQRSTVIQLERPIIKYQILKNRMPTTQEEQNNQVTQNYVNVWNVL